MAQDNWEEGKEVKSNWFKFEKVGDKIKGTLLKKSFQKTNTPGYQDQWIYELKKEDGQIFSVGISAGKTGTVQRLNNCSIGEVVGILLEKIIPTTDKKKKDTKALKILSFGMDPDYKAGEEAGADGEFKF